MSSLLARASLHILVAGLGPAPAGWAPLQVSAWSPRYGGGAAARALTADRKSGQHSFECTCQLLVRLLYTPSINVGACTLANANIARRPSPLNMTLYVSEPIVEPCATTREWHHQNHTRLRTAATTQLHWLLAAGKHYVLHILEAILNRILHASPNRIWSGIVHIADAFTDCLCFDTAAVTLYCRPQQI